MAATDQAAAMVAAARRRHEETFRKAIEAIRRLDAAGEPITFAAIAADAGISRAWLYREPGVRAEIDGLRRPSRQSGRRERPAAERATADSLHAQLDALRSLEAELLAENKRLPGGSGSQARPRASGSYRRRVVSPLTTSETCR
jgi:hypothetical protein